MTAMRKNGYYFYQDKQLPSVSSILKSVGDAGGLVKWGAKQGGLGVIWGLAAIKDTEALKAKLGSPSCIEWACEQAQAGLEAESERVTGYGQRVHAGIEARLKKQELDTSGWGEDEKTALTTFFRFYEEVGFDPVSVETVVYSPLFSYAGQLDLVAEVSEDQADKLRPYLMRSSPDIKPGLLISDFKTGSIHLPKQGAQLAAYEQAYHETYKRKCSGGLLINIPREEPEKVKCFYFGTEDLNTYWKKFQAAFEAWFEFESPKWFRGQTKKEAA